MAEINKGGWDPRRFILTHIGKNCAICKKRVRSVRYGLGDGGSRPGVYFGCHNDIDFVEIGEAVSRSAAALRCIIPFDQARISRKLGITQSAFKSKQEEDQSKMQAEAEYRAFEKERQNRVVQGLIEERNRLQAKVDAIASGPTPWPILVRDIDSGAVAIQFGPNGEGKGEIGVDKGRTIQERGFTAFDEIEFYGDRAAKDEPPSEPLGLRAPEVKPRKIVLED